MWSAAAVTPLWIGRQRNEGRVPVEDRCDTFVIQSAAAVGAPLPPGVQGEPLPRVNGGSRVKLVDKRPR